MSTLRWLLAIPLGAVLLVGTSARGSAIRDEAHMFSPEVVDKAQRRLEQLERKTNIPVVIETIEHVPGLPADAPRPKRLRAIEELAVERDKKIHDEGIYILISNRDHLISQPLARAYLKDVLPMSKRDEIREAFTEEFKKGNYDRGLERGVEAIEEALRGVRVDRPHAGGRAAAPVPIGQGARRGGGSMLGTFLLIGGGIFVVLILLRLLGGLFNRGAGAGYPNQMAGPRPGMGPGMGPGGMGYGGGPGYGGRGGGGFFSGLLGGLGGALAGNWLYDQMSGRHGGMNSAGAGYPVDDHSASVPDQGDDAIIGADDHGGQGASWDDPGGADAGGGDWGGGDQGGDWGGGGGDWGGGDGGGDWGGGGGGGDW